MGRDRAGAGAERRGRGVRLKVALLLVPVVVLALVAALGVAGGREAGTVRGLVVDVAGDLTSVSQFTVLSEDGERLVLVPGDDGDFDFPLPHLRDHLRTGEPVVVGYEEREGGLVAVALADG